MLFFAIAGFLITTKLDQKDLTGGISSIVEEPLASLQLAFAYITLVKEIDDMS